MHNAKSGQLKISKKAYMSFMEWSKLYYILRWTRYCIKKKRLDMYHI